MAGVLGKANVQFVSRGATTFKHVQLAREQTVRRERGRSDIIRYNEFREYRHVYSIDCEFQQWCKRLDREKTVFAPRLRRTRCQH